MEAELIETKEQMEQKQEELQKHYKHKYVSAPATITNSACQFDALIFVDFSLFSQFSNCYFRVRLGSLDEEHNQALGAASSKSAEAKKEMETLQGEVILLK